MTLEYAQPTYPEQPCRCGSHSQHRLFKFLLDNPGASLKSAARELHLSYDNARQIHSRLMRRSDISRLCPECGTPSLNGLVCSNCGAELDRPSVPMEVSFKSQSPTHTIHPLNGLGSFTDYNRLGLQYGGRNVAHIVERADNPLLERCKSELWEELKEVMPPDGVVEEATRLLVKEVREFEAKYPDLTRAKGLSRQLVRGVVRLMALRYPQLRRSDTVTRSMPESMQNHSEGKVFLSGERVI